MAVYNNECLICAEEYIGKTQDYGTGGYLRADAFAKHFAEHCRDEPNSNAVRARMKEICRTTILWQGDRIQCMKSSRTPQCTICMVERTEILGRMRTNRSKVINDNSDIYASCKCRSRLHKFNRMLEPTLRRRLTPKKVSSNRRSKQKRNRRKKSINISIDASPVEVRMMNNGCVTIIEMSCLRNRYLDFIFGDISTATHIFLCNGKTSSQRASF